MYRAFSLLLILSSFTIHSAHAQEFSIVSGNGYAPFAGEELPAGGMSTEVVKAVFEKMGDTVKIDFKPWKRGYQEAYENQYLGTYPYVRNDERLKQFFYSEPIHEIKTLFFVHHDSKIKYREASDLKGLVVCLPLGFNLQNIQDFLDSKILTLHQLPTLEKCFQMLEAKRVDLIPINEATGKATIKTLYGPQSTIFKTLEKPLTAHDTLHFIISRNYPGGEEVMRRFNTALKELKKHGTTQAIADKHLH